MESAGDIGAGKCDAVAGVVDTEAGDETATDMVETETGGEVATAGGGGVVDTEHTEHDRGKDRDRDR